MPKAYDRAYFDRWYRGEGIGGMRVQRKAMLALAMAEMVLERPVRTVLDIGCGEGAWRAPLLKARPKLRYLGFDSSAYCVRRYGARRDLHQAGFGDFSLLRPCPPVDLLVCSDVLHYLGTPELDRGLPGLAELCGGVAFLETFCRGDGAQGDMDGFHARPARFYIDRLAALGFSPLGMHCWLSPRLDASMLSALERPACNAVGRGG